MFEDALRPKSKDLIPDLDQLLADPVRYLTVHDGIYVGPRRYPLVAVFSGLISGLVGGLLGLMLNYLLFLNAAEWLVPIFAVFGLGLGATVWRKNRGGEAHIIPAGVVFSKGEVAVFCPWDVFDPWSDLRLESTWVWLPLSMPASQQITETLGGTVRRTGAAVNTRFAVAVRPGIFSRLFRGTDPAAPPEKLKVRDAYAIRGGEFFPLLMRISEAAKLAALERRVDEVGVILSQRRSSSMPMPPPPATAR
jgi:hypothetical protein